MAAENAHDVAPYDGPALVYGLWGDDCFALVEQEWAEGAAAEIEAIRSAPTWGAAYAAGEAATYIHSTIEEDLAGHDPNDPLDPNEIPGAADGDWPPMLPIYTAEYLPKDWGVGDYYGTVLNGDGIIIPVPEEAQLVEMAERSGAVLTRDDALVGRLSPGY